MVLLYVILCDHEEKSFIRCEIRANTNFIEEKTKCCTYVHVLVRTRANVRYYNDNFVIPVKAKRFRNAFSIGRRRELSTAASIHGRRLFSRGGKKGSNIVISPNGFGKGILFCLLKGRGRGGKGENETKNSEKKLLF